jgi:hypothetical protein
MSINTSVFVHLEFWLLVLFSLVVPTGIYAWLMYKRAISRVTVLLLGIVLVSLSALDVYLLQRVEGQSKITPSLADDEVFLSEVTLALYLLPLLFAGVGINMISHVLIEHLAEAEKRFDEEHPRRGRTVRLRILRGARPRRPSAVIDESRDG